ncbi:MAG: CRISPR-associated endonuclease Cas2 [Geminicoccaceae bacterium]|nr:CRISPR-associated endonuclease Cas2 [Geminicoccaceae bacterium]
MGEEHLIVVAYDIADPKRWRRVYKFLLGYGEWLQLSVFQCRLDRKRLVQLEAGLRERIHAREDHVLLLDLGPADRVQPRVRSLGKAFEVVRREPIVI